MFRKIKPLAAVILLASLAGNSCNRLTETACTMEFRTIGINVQNGALQRFYTLRLENGDTLYHQYDSIMAGYYTVLDDGAMGWLKGKEENFKFEGWRNDSLVIEANYRIGADQCHIYKVSGPTNWP
jgi:hypothetical protein